MNAGLLALLGSALILIRPSTRPSRSAGQRLSPPAVPEPGRASSRRPRLAPSRGLPVLAAIGIAIAAGVTFGPGGLVAAAVVSPFVVGVMRRVATWSRDGADRRMRPAVPLLLDLIAAALRAGAPTASAVGAIAAVSPGTLGAHLSRTAALLQLGAEPAEAWAAVREHEVLGPVATVATRSADSGIRLADGFERHAGEVRAQLRTDGVARANRVATLALLPLGLCFLPAFICIGIVPVVVGIAGDAFSTVSGP